MKDNNLLGKEPLGLKMGRGGFGLHEFQIGGAEVYRIDEVTPAVEAACLRIAAAGFGRDERNPSFAADVATHIRDGDLYVAKEGGLPVAFRILQKPLPAVLHLAGAVKVPGAQRHLVREMTEEIIRSNGQTKTLTTRTGNDHVLDEMLHLCEDVVPFSSGVDEVARELLIVAGLYPEGIRPDTLVTPNNYGGQPMVDSSRGRPQSRNEEVAEFMRSVMTDQEYFNGAAIMLVGRELKI